MNFVTLLGALGGLLVVVVALCVGTKENAAECTVTGTEIEWPYQKWKYKLIESTSPGVVVDAVVVGDLPLVIFH